MIMPRRFSFGIPSYFNFTFQAGPQFPSFANGTINVQSNSNVNADPESSNEIETLIPSPLHGTGNTVSSPCGTLNKLPLELRIKVYMNVLNFERAIKKAHIFLGTFFKQESPAPDHDLSCET